MFFTVESPNVAEDDQKIVSTYMSHGTHVELGSGKSKYVVKPYSKEYIFVTEKTVPKVGVMLVGMGGNNGSSFCGMVLANRHNIKWMTKKGEMKSNFIGSLTQATSIRLGVCDGKNEDGLENEEIYIPFKDILPMVPAVDLELGGWDICKDNLKVAMHKAEVFDYNLQLQLDSEMEKLVPLPSIFDPSFVAANQKDRANNILPQNMNKMDKVKKIMKDIEDFKKERGVEKVIVLWTANTERMSEVKKGIHDTAANFIKAVENNEKEISPSSLFALACILSNTPFINGSPQNTLLPCIDELAIQKGVFIAGADFKTGQTKIKSVLTDFLVSSGLKPRSIVSYNHLGNNDGANLSAAETFKSKETSKKHVVDDIFLSNPTLYPRKKNIKEGEAEIDPPDHCIVIKYIPFVGDSKRAMDEYSSEICMGGINTIVLHNTCEDSLLAIPVMLDLVILTELFTRIKFGELPQSSSTSSSSSSSSSSSLLSLSETVPLHHFHPLLGSLLGFLLKAPHFPSGMPVINSLFKQRLCLENILRVCRGMSIRSMMGLNKMYRAMKRGEEERRVLEEKERK